MGSEPWLDLPGAGAIPAEVVNIFAPWLRDDGCLAHD